MAFAEKLEYTQTITRDEVKRFTDYKNRKSEVDAKTGHDNLDFKYEKAELNEYVVRITTLDGQHIFLPIPLTDGEGLHADGFLYRPKTEAERTANAEEEAIRKTVRENFLKKKAAGRIHDEAQ